MIYEVIVKKKIGRPLKRSPKEEAEVKEQFVQLMLEGERIKKACEICQIGKATYHQWISEDLDFLNRYTHARDIYVDNFIEEMVDDVENCPEDKVSIQKQKLITDLKLNLLEKIFPKKYGKHVNVDHTLELMSERIKRIRTEEEARISGSEQAIPGQNQLENRPEIGTSDSDAEEAEFDD